MKHLTVANKPCSLCNKHMDCLVEPSRPGIKPCPYYQDWHDPKYEPALTEPYKPIEVSPEDLDESDKRVEMII